MEEQPLFTCRRARCNAAGHDPCPFPEGLDLGLSHDHEEESVDLSLDREGESVSEASLALRSVCLRARVELHLKALACTAVASRTHGCLLRCDGSSRADAKQESSTSSLPVSGLQASELKVCGAWQRKVEVRDPL
jgi:hypothetical protein